MPPAPVLHLTVRGDATVEEAWDRYARPARWPEWSPQIGAVDAPARIAPGVRGVVHAALVPGAGVDFTVLDVDEAAHAWTWEVVPRVPGARLPRLVLHHTLRAAAGGSETGLEIRAGWVALPLAAGYAPLARRALRRLVSARR